MKTTLRHHYRLPPPNPDESDSIRPDPGEKRARRTRKRARTVFPSLLCTLLFLTTSAQAQTATNLLLNPTLEFISFDNSRTGAGVEHHSSSIAGWEQAAYGDAEAWRAARQTAFRTPFMVDNAVLLHPGKSLHQFALLSELGLDGNEAVSLSVYGHQGAPQSLQAAIRMMRLDSENGEWSPKDFGLADARTFPKHSRGELTAAPSFTQASGAEHDFELKVENAVIPFGFTESGTKSTAQPNVIGIIVEFTNTSKEDVWLYSPCLTRGPKALNHLPEGRTKPAFYRSLPRTMQKLWRGDPLHIIVMGSSIDRGSANPQMVPYDEDPKSPTFKQPLVKTTSFDGAVIGHPEWNDYIGEWRHHFGYGGRFRQWLMQRFNYPMDRLLLNIMACDGSCISESHSGLDDYASLKLPPDPAANGQGKGKSWQELYPAVFARPEGARPDLVIFGSGANEKVDGADEVAAFEGAIRWYQRHYPGIEFVFCMWQNRESYSPNTGHLRELSLRYQIPFIDLGRAISETTRYCNSSALVPNDGHPQAAAHYLWERQLERAFDVGGPIEPGIAQLQLPERLSSYTPGWEGDVRTYNEGDKRLRHNKGLILDDTFVNLWAKTKDETVTVHVDGVVDEGSRRKATKARDGRNSSFAKGRLSLGDRHIVEVSGNESAFIAADSKMAVNRQWRAIGYAPWRLSVKMEMLHYHSEWGAPYGETLATLSPDITASLSFTGTDVSIAYVDAADGGEMVVLVDGEEKLRTSTSQPFTDAEGKTLYMENRKGIRGLPYGWHEVVVKSASKTVHLLGAFTYDLRPNRSAERIERGESRGGDVITFSAPFKARPLVICHDGLTVNIEDVTTTSVKFSGEGLGSYEIVGE